ncbi:MAG: NADH-quinone oxidoreductase subunit NuoF [Elusimicrobiota bacterium]
MGTCGIAAGAKEAWSVFEHEIKANNLKNVSLIQTGCLGACSFEPMVEVITPGMENVVYKKVFANDAKEILKNHIIEKRVIEEKKYILNSRSNRIVLRNCGVIDPENIEDYICYDGYIALEKALFEMSPDDIITELKKSGLRGRGGAGFPTGLKWAFSKDAKSDQKFIVCNADEGDPGAYMDRSTLEGDPFSILEAMAIAGRTVGADKGYIYIRAEYPLAIERLKRAIEKSTQYALLGNNILGSDFNFDIELRLGAGAFVCGEETALLASIEGERGMPKPRPPYPAVKGLWGKPTVINNVETLANIPAILTRGSAWFSGIGTETSKGTKVFALTGKIKNSGLIEVPMGTPLREIVYSLGGGIGNDKKFKAAQTGGPSGGVIPESHLDIKIDYESLTSIGSMMGSGGMIVMDEDDCIVDVAKFYLQFSVDESCGKCSPCRIGGYQLYLILEKISRGKGEEQDIIRLRSIASAMQKASLCGLGQTAGNPVLSTLNYFMDEYEEHIKHKKCRAKKCINLLSYSINQKKCIKCGLCKKVCPAGAVLGDRESGFSIDEKKCIKCGECFKACKFKAIKKD